MAKRFCDNGFALVKAATPFSLSARTVIADTATVATTAANKHAGNNDGAPTAATRKAPKGSSIIAIASRRTDAVCAKGNRP